MTDWDENWSGGFSPGGATGGLKGFGKSWVLSRHCDLFCNPGMWSICISIGSELCDLFEVGAFNRAAVQDDFGNLVVIPR